MNWRHPILTGSGFQVFSLGDLNKISEEGVRFQSHLDGSYHLFTPESVMELQHALGADIIMAFDECTPYPCERDYAADSMQMTLRWAERCLNRHRQLSIERSHRLPQALVSSGERLPRPAPNLHRGAHRDGSARLRHRSGRGRATRGDVCSSARHYAAVAGAKTTYLMGGPTARRSRAVAAGIDMFGCVVPTRNARNGTVFTRAGRLRLKNARYAEDSSPPEADCACKTCAHYSRAYLRHLSRLTSYWAYIWPPSIMSFSSNN